MTREEGFEWWKVFDVGDVHFLEADKHGLCYGCLGEGLNFHFPGFDLCSECLGSGKQEDAERISKLRSFR